MVRGPGVQGSLREHLMGKTGEGREGVKHGREREELSRAVVLEEVQLCLTHDGGWKEP